MNVALKGLAAACLLVWTGIGVLAALRLVEREDPEARARDEEVLERLARLEDRVAVTGRDLEGLAHALSENFGRLSEAVQALDAGGAPRGPGVRRAPAAATPAASGEPAAPEPTGVPAASEPAARSFLAFELPSRDFRFAGKQTFDLLPALSRVGFDAESTLHDFSGIADDVAGSFTVDLARPDELLEGRVEIEARDLTTGLEGRDEKMLEHLTGEGATRLSFEATGFRPESVDVEAMELRGRLAGRMTIRGRTRDVELDVTARVDESRRLNVEGETRLLMSDFGISVPSQLGMISVEDEVRVWIHLRARARPERSEPSEKDS